MVVLFYRTRKKCWCCFICLYYRTIRPDSIVRSIYKATGCSDNPNHHVIYLEHVVVRITITHPRRGDLAIYLTSPSGTRSQLLANRYSMTTQLHSAVSMQSPHWDCRLSKEQSSHYSGFAGRHRLIIFSERDGKSEVQMSSQMAISVCRRVGCKVVEGHHLQNID